MIIDGSINYTGPRVETVVGDPKFSPLGVGAGGLFEVTNSNNVSIEGTKRSLVDLKGNAAGVYTKNSKGLTVSGVNFKNGQDTIFLDGQVEDATIENNFVQGSTFRAIWLKNASGTDVRNNLLFDSDLDGVDVDAFSKSNTIDSNTSVEVNKRFHFWNEIASTDNQFRNNVAIHRLSGNNSGGIQENGSEVGQAKTARNSFIGNHVFYAKGGAGSYGGVSINENRGVNVNSITFKDNFVWTNGSKFANNQDIAPSLNDVRYLTTANPVAFNQV